MQEKVRKTLYLPDWVVEMLDDEGSVGDGPGVTAAAAIYHFCKKDDEEKKRILKDYANYSIESTYGCGGGWDPESQKRREIRIEEIVENIKEYAVRYKIPGTDEQKLIDGLRQALGDDAAARANADKMRRKRDLRGDATGG